MLDKKTLSERDICTKFVTPAVEAAGWDIQTQVREEVTFTAGRVIVRGRLTSRGEKKRADYVLYRKPNLPIALIEAKDNKHPVGGGMQQALAYGEALDVPFVFSSNGDAFLAHDRTNKTTPEKELALVLGPSSEQAVSWPRGSSRRSLPDGSMWMPPASIPESQGVSGVSVPQHCSRLSSSSPA